MVVARFYKVKSSDEIFIKKKVLRVYIATDMTKSEQNKNKKRNKGPTKPSKNLLKS